MVNALDSFLVCLYQEKLSRPCRSCKSNNHTKRGKITTFIKDGVNLRNEEWVEKLNYFETSS
jgi:hypothetical protein